MASSKYAAFRQDLMLRWLLRMTKMACYARLRQRVDVGSADVEDVRLAPVSAGSVRGQIFADNPADSRTVMYRFMRFLMTVQNSDFGGAGDFDRSSGASVHADGSFEIKNVTAGRYAVEFISGSGEPGKYYVRSVRLGAFAADAGFSINGSAGPLYITLSSHSATIEGSAVDDHDKPLIGLHRCGCSGRTVSQNPCALREGPD